MTTLVDSTLHNSVNAYETGSGLWIGSSDAPMTFAESIHHQSSQGDAFAQHPSPQTRSGIATRPANTAYKSCPNLPVLGSLSVSHASGSSQDLATSRSATPTFQEPHYLTAAPVTPPIPSPTIHLLPAMPPLSRSYSESHLPPAPQYGTEQRRSSHRAAHSPTFLTMTPVTTTPQSGQYVDSPQHSSSGEPRPQLFRSSSTQSLFSTTSSSASSQTPSYLEASFPDASSSEASETHLLRSMSAASLASSSGFSEEISRSLSASTNSVLTAGSSPATSISSNSPSAVFSLFKSTKAKAAPSPYRTRRTSKLTELDRKRICEFSRDNPQLSQDFIGNRFGVERSTISKTLKDKDRWFAVPEPGSAATTKMSRKVPPILSPNKAASRSCRFPRIEEEVVVWIRAQNEAGEVLSDQRIRDHALRVAANFQIPYSQFKASQGWLDKFKLRANISMGRITEDEEPMTPSSAMVSTSSFDDDAASVFSSMHEDQDIDMSSHIVGQSASYDPASTSRVLQSPVNVTHQAHQFACPPFPVDATSLHSHSPHNFSPSVPSHGALPLEQSSSYSQAAIARAIPVPPPIYTGSINAAMNRIVRNESALAHSPATPESPTFRYQTQLENQQSIGAGTHRPYAARRATISVPGAAPHPKPGTSNRMFPLLDTTRNEVVTLPLAMRSLELVNQFFYEQPQLCTALANQALAELRLILNQASNYTEPSSSDLRGFNMQI